MEPQAPTAKPLTVLVVEDEYMVAVELSDLLRDDGYEVIGPVPTVSAALAMLDSQPPDACLLDVNLRGEQSGPVAQALRDRGIPFLLSSAYGPDTLDHNPAFAGTVNVGKPVSRQQLGTALAALLPGRR